MKPKSGLAVVAAVAVAAAATAVVAAVATAAVAAATVAAVATAAVAAATAVAAAEIVVVAAAVAVAAVVVAATAAVDAVDETTKPNQDLGSAREKQWISINSRVRIPTSEMQISFSKSSGPGGQNVNKVNSKALLRWNVLASPHLTEALRARFLAAYGNRLTRDGELLISSQRFRDAPRNAEDCIEKLREMLIASAKVPKTRKPTRPSRASKERRLEAKRRTSERKQSRRKVDD
jgi:ribosome-associated protein